MRSFMMVAAVGVASVLAQDPCTQIDTCTDCVNSISNCGWCSTKVVYETGIVGSHCAGPSSGPAFTCSGIYSTEECVKGYLCNTMTYQCYEGEGGQGSRKEECEAACTDKTPVPGPPAPPGTGYECEAATGDCKVAGVGKGVPLAACQAGCVVPTPPAPTPTPAPAAPVYVCSAAHNYTCVEAAAGTPGAAAKEICEEDCQKPSPPGPPSPPSPPSPPTPPGPPTPPVPPAPPAAKVYKCDYTEGQCKEVPSGTSGSGSLLVCNETCHTAPPGPPSGFRCRFEDFQCVAGGTETQEDCERDCLGWYACDEASKTCLSVNASHPGATNKTTCDSNCATEYVCNTTTLQCLHEPGSQGNTSAGCEAYCQESWSCQDDLTCKSGPPGSGIPNKTMCESLCVPAYQCNADTLKCDPVAPSKGSSLERCELGCVTNYACNDDWQCVEVAPGHGYRNQSSCEDVCVKPAPYYQCNYDTYQCDEVSAGSPPPATSNKTACEEGCVMPPPTPGPPSGLKGLWRALEVQNGYTAGEFDVHFEDDAMTIVSSTGVTMKGSVETAADSTVLINVQVGTGTGKVVRALFQAQNSPGPEASYGEFALGQPGGDAPLSISTAMKSNLTVYVMAKCLSQACTFRMQRESASARVGVSLSGDAEIVSLGGRMAKKNLPQVKAVNDPCLIHGSSCEACLAFSKTCGWCSVIVTYQDGTNGTRCAGTSLGIEPFTCNGKYSTGSCPGPTPSPSPTPAPTPPPGPPTPTPPPAALKYECNFTSLQCVDTGRGKQTLEGCESFCQNPKPSPPADVLGYWRGYQIVNGYSAGEVDITFTKSVTTMYVNGTQLWEAHVQTYGGVYMRFDIVSGKYQDTTFQVMYQKTFVNLMKAMSLAFSAPNEPMPASFDEAMVQPDDSYIFYQCADAACVFTPPSE